jgi:hypothetical protein
MSFSLRATLGLDASNFESVLLNQENAARAWGKKLKHNINPEEGHGEGPFAGAVKDLIGLEALHKIGDFALERTKQALEMAHNIRSISQDIGASTEMVQVYGEVFDGTESLTTAFKSLAEAQGKALEAGPEAAKYQDALARLGVSIEDLKSKSTDQLFQQIGEGIKDATVDATELADVAEVLGKSGVKMIDGFKRGIQETHEEMAKGGQIISKQELDQLEEAKRSIDRLDRGLTVMFANAITGWENFFTRGSFSQGPEDERTDFQKQMDALREKPEKDRKEQMEAKRVADAKHQASVSEIAAIEIKISELKFKELSKDEKRVQLAKERKEIEHSILAQNIATDEGKVAMAKLRERLEQNKVDAEAVKEDKVKEEKVKREKPDVNEAEKRGAFAYSRAQNPPPKAPANPPAQNPSQAVLQKSANHLAQIEAHMNRAEQTASKTNEHMAHMSANMDKIVGKLGGQF